MKKQYENDRYYKMATEEKQRLKECQKNYRETRKTKVFNNS